MIQAPDIGKVILEHTADSHVIELPFGLGEWQLPGPWYIPGTSIDVAPTKHVVFMILAAVLVFLTIWYGGRLRNVIARARGRAASAPQSRRWCSSFGTTSR